jgi:hypothetical protein
VSRHEYRVAWAIDVDADSPREAAQAARDAQTRDATTATVFEVAQRVGERYGERVVVDLAEPEQPDKPVRPPVPAFTKDVTGKYFGGAYWNEAEYRVIVETMDGTGERFLLRLESDTGYSVNEVEFNDTQADRLRDLARSSEEADDEGLGLSREIHWHIGDERNEVDLDVNFLEELAEWIDTIFDGSN